jgi:hypothetical protein
VGVATKYRLPRGFPRVHADVKTHDAGILLLDLRLQRPQQLVTSQQLLSGKTEVVFNVSRGND